MRKNSDFVIKEKDAGVRLDQALAKRFSEISRTVLQNLIKSGNVTVDGEQAKPNLKLKGGEKICLRLPEPEEKVTLVPTRLTFPILYEDTDIIAIDKPGGLSTHPGAGREKDSVVAAVLSHCPLSSIGAPVRPGIVHRLDKGTTGVMVLAKTDKSHKRLVKLFSTHAVEKEYFALVQGAIREERGIIDVAIDRDRVHRKRMKATYLGKGRPARSTFEVAERLPGATLVRVLIETGRTHQIRVHMAFIGHPLLGDTLYGGKKFFSQSMHFLHCSRLALAHPITGKPVEWKADLPREFRNALDRVRQPPER